jgi:uncharacterized protein with NAD-binding domain and iron-sulfur cluster
MEYDYIIIGSSPSGLTCAYYLAKLGRKILLIDKDKKIGGSYCVDRIDGLFYEKTQHFYSDSFQNFKKLLSNFGTSFNNLFNPIKYSWLKLNYNEILILIFEYIRLFYNEEFSKNISIDNFINKKKFCKQSIKYINSIANLTKQFTLYEFLQLNIKGLDYKLYQPKLSNDFQLLNIWTNKILDTNNCTIKLNSEITDYNYDNKKLVSLDINNNTVKANKYILVSDNVSNEYFTVYFHWDSKLNLQDICEIPISDWGIIYNILSNYMYFNDSRSVTVISVVITLLYTKSTFSNKCALESHHNELLNETFRQLQETFINLPKPTYSIFQNNCLKKNKINNILLNKQFNNLYNINCLFNNTIESSIVDSINLINRLESNMKNKIKIYKTEDIIEIFKFLFAVYFILYIFKYI